MKKLTLAIALLTMTVIAFAGPNKQVTLAAERNVSASIRSQIQFPEFLKEKDGEHSAAIFFTVTDCGLIKVCEIRCDDEDLKANLMAQAEHIKISTAGLDTRDTYKVVVRFETM